MDWPTLVSYPWAFPTARRSHAILVQRSERRGCCRLKRNRMRLGHPFEIGGGERRLPSRPASARSAGGSYWFAGYLPLCSHLADLRCGRQRSQPHDPRVRKRKTQQRGVFHMCSPDMVGCRYLSFMAATDASSTRTPLTANTIPTPPWAATAPSKGLETPIARSRQAV